MPFCCLAAGLSSLTMMCSVWKRTELVEDPLIKLHLGKLYEQLLESNLIKIIQPFSCVEIEHVAHLIKLPLPQIELKCVSPDDAGSLLGAC
jgi:hypothetical protein